MCLNTITTYHGLDWQCQTISLFYFNGKGTKICITGEFSCLSSINVVCNFLVAIVTNWFPVVVSVHLSHSEISWRINCRTVSTSWWSRQHYDFAELEISDAMYFSSQGFWYSNQNPHPSTSPWLIWNALPISSQIGTVLQSLDPHCLTWVPNYVWENTFRNIPYYIWFVCPLGGSG